MKNAFFRARPFFTPLVCAALLLMPGQAVAQRCDIDEEVIIKLRRAEIGAYAVWYGVHGDEKSEGHYASGALLENGHVLVAGERSVMGKPHPELVFTEVDRRGRAIYETKRNVSGLSRVLGIEPLGKDFVVSALLSDGTEKAALWVGIVDQKGALRHEKIFRSTGRSVISANITPSADGKGFAMIMATEDKQGDAGNRYSEFYRLNSKIGLISKRSYNPGPDSGIYSAVPIEAGGYLVSGYIDNALGRKTGWLLKVDEEGGIVWQRQYPRGIGAVLAKAVEMPDGSILAIGEALPGEEDPLKAAWVMNVAADNGALIWQRYLTGSIDYSAKDVMISDDGLISVVVNANSVDGKMDEEGMDKAQHYVRLVTFNPRGVIFDSLAFFEGEKAQAKNMILGPSRERIMIGDALVAYQDEMISGGDDMKMAEKGNGKAIKKRSSEGWIVAAPAAAPYQDPCKPKKERVLDDL